MRFYISIRCIIMYLFVTLVVVVQSQDLFNMFGDIKDQVVEKVKGEARKYVPNTKDNEPYPVEYKTVLTAYRQLIREWLEKFPSQDAKEYRLLLKLTSSEFKRLEKFASSSRFEQKEVLNEVHIISDLLKRMVYKIEEDNPEFYSLTWSAWLRSFDINGIIKIIFALLIIGAFSFISIRTHLSRGRWFTTFFIVAFIFSVFQNWYTLYQEALAKVDEVLMKKIPKHCQGQSMGVFDMITAQVGRFFKIPVNECFEYHKALRATPHAQVTIVQAISMTCAQLFVTPLGAIGEGLSQFFAGTMRHVPGFLWPFIIVLILIIIIVFTLMYSKYEIHLPFMMGSIRPSPHAAVTRTTHVVEQIENPTDRVQQLENRIEQLQLQLQQRNPQIEYNSTSTIRASRSSSIGRVDHPQQQQRERSSSSNRRSNTNALTENELRQRTTSADIGFRRDILPQ